MVWPAVWPGVLVLCFLMSTSGALPGSLVAVLAHLAFGGLVYAALFFRFGLERQERLWVASALQQVWRRRADGLAAA